MISNDASRALDAAWADAVNDGDLDGFVAMLNPGYVHQPHQRLQVHETFGVDEALEIARGMITGRATVTTETLAVRGNNIALGRWVAKFGTDIVELIAITVVGDDGLIVRCETFEPEGLHDALDRLDEIHAEHGGPSPLIDIRRCLRRANLDGDREAVRSGLASDLDRTRPPARRTRFARS